MSLSNSLIIVAHPDDEVLGAYYFITKGAKVEIIGKGRGDEDDNQFDKYPLMHWIKKVEKLIEKHKPDTVITHHHNDLNIDHRIIFNAVMTACRPWVVKKILSCFVGGASNFNYPSTFKPNVFCKINAQDKWDYLDDKYPEESREYPHPRSEVGIISDAMHWGQQSNLKHAEPYELIREVID